MNQLCPDLSLRTFVNDLEKVSRWSQYFVHMAPNSTRKMPIQHYWRNWAGMMWARKPCARMHTSICWRRITRRRPALPSHVHRRRRHSQGRSRSWAHSTGRRAGRWPKSPAAGHRQSLGASLRRNQRKRNKDPVTKAPAARNEFQVSPESGIGPNFSPSR